MDGKRCPTYMSVNLTVGQREQVHHLLSKYVDWFAWDYTEMPGLDWELVEHRLHKKRGFQPYKQPPRIFNEKMISRVKEEIDRLLQAKFIWPCCYAEWVSNIMLMEKKNTGKIRVCVDFRNLNRATPKDECPMPVADTLINNASGNKMISFLDRNADYNQIFMDEEGINKTAFYCPSFVGLFEWVVMTFGLKNARATYQGDMNLIIHDLQGSSWRCILMTW
jgi:hypothetical protein